MRVYKKTIWRKGMLIKELIIMGDFNEILEGDEHSSYQDSGLVNTGMREFESVVQYCNLTDLGAQGPMFT